MEAKNRKTIKSGYYTRLEWPDPGSALDQTKIVVDCFRIIKDEEMRILAAKVK